MILELADNRKKYVNVQAYRRRPIVRAHRRKKAVLSENYNPYIYIPPHLNDGHGVFVREDHLDFLNDSEWDNLMDNVLDHQPDLAAKGKGKARREAKKEKKAEKKEARTQRKAAKKDAKQKKKVDKNERKNKRTQSRADARTTKAEAKRLKGQAKVDKQNRAGGGDDEDESIFDRIVNKASDVYTKVKGGASNFLPRGEDEEEEESGSGGSGGSGGSSNTIMGIPKPIAIGGGIAIALGLAYIATRPKTSKAA